MTHAGCQVTIQHNKVGTGEKSRNIKSKSRNNCEKVGIFKHQNSAKYKFCPTKRQNYLHNLAVFGQKTNSLWQKNTPLQDSTNCCPRNPDP